MTTPPDLLEQAREACAGLDATAPQSAAEARERLKSLALAIKRLRLLKREAAIEMRTARATFRVESAKIKTVSASSAVIGGLLGRRTAASIRTAQRQGLRDARENELRPYEFVLNHLDGLLLSLEAARLAVLAIAARPPEATSRSRTEPPEELP